MVFKSRKAPAPRSEEEFLSEADASPKVDPQTSPKAPPVTAQAAKPAEDPTAPPSKTFNLRLNLYQVELLRQSAKAARRSMQQQALAVLLEGLEPGLK